MQAPQHRHRNSEQGASAVEYAILVSLIAVIILIAVAFLGTNLAGSFQNSCESVAHTNGATC